MDTLPFANESPVSALSSSGMEQAGKPGKRDRDGAAIAQVYTESVFCYGYSFSRRNSDFNCGNSHAMLQVVFIGDR